MSVLAEMSAQDAAIVISACSGAFVTIIGIFLKYLLQTRKEATEANKAVNGRPHDEPTLRELVERIDIDLDQFRRESTTRHDENSRRIDRVSIAVDAQTRKMDRLADAIGGTNRRIDKLEEDG